VTRRRGTVTQPAERPPAVQPERLSLSWLQGVEDVRVQRRRLL